MNLSIPASVRELLHRFRFTPQEEQTVELICATSLMVRGFGGNEDIVAGIRGCWLSAYGIRDSEIKGSVGGDWVQFIEEKICSLDDLRLLVSDQSPYYGLAAKGDLTPSERFCYFMEDVASGRWAPLPMRELWHKELFKHDGDSIAAEVNLAFLEPELESPKGR